MNTVNFFSESLRRPVFNEEMVQKQVGFLIQNEGKVQGEISVIFCTDEYLLEMNQKYLEHDYYTDIITFDYVEGSKVSGDLFISIERVKENSNHYDRSFEDELYRVIFHGILHLTGYSDHTEEEVRVMREKENFYLSGITGERIKNDT